MLTEMVQQFIFQKMFMTMGNAKPSSCALVCAPSFRGAKLTRSKHASQPFSWRAAALLAYSYTLQKRGKLAKVPSVLHTQSHKWAGMHAHICSQNMEDPMLGRK